MYIATSSSLLVLLIILVLIINPIPPAGVNYLCGRRPQNHPLPLNDPPIVPLYLWILLLRRGSKDRGHEAADKGEDHNTIDYRTATPQEVLE